MNFVPYHSDKSFKTQALPAQLAFHLPMKNRMLLIRLKKGTLFSEYKKYQNKGRLFAAILHLLMQWLYELLAT